MRRLMTLAGVLALLAGAAEARGHGFSRRAPHAPHAGKAPHAAKAPRGSGEGRRHRSGIGEIGTLGPSHFHPVKPYRGFSYLQHEKHPGTED